MPFDLPWFAWLFAGLFWSLMLLRLVRGRGAGGGDASALPNEDGPRWSPFRGGGF